MDEAHAGIGGRAERVLVVRLWREGEDAQSVWRCSVEDLASRQRRGFATLAEFLPFLQELTGSADLRRAADAGAFEGKLLEPRDRTQ